jgi:hypothetical protein
VTRVLALADEVHGAFYGDRLLELRPDLVVGCGDLPFDYLEYIVTMLNVPLLFVPGNHDPDLSEPAHNPHLPPIMPTPIADVFAEPPGPSGCTSVDCRVVDAAGLRVAGLGGSIRYSPGANQYTQGEMRRRALRLEWRITRRKLVDRRGIDLLVTHSPPAGVSDGTDPAHRGFEAFHRLMARLRPRMLLHGHVHPYGQASPDQTVGRTRVVNAVAYRLLEV